jgi:hypothetical protein
VGKGGGDGAAGGTEQAVIGDCCEKCLRGDAWCAELHLTCYYMWRWRCTKYGILGECEGVGIGKKSREFPSWMSVSSSTRPDSGPLEISSRYTTLTLPAHPLSIDLHAAPRFPSIPLDSPRFPSIASGNFGFSWAFFDTEPHHPRFARMLVHPSALA